MDQMRIFKATKCPTDELSTTNCAIIHPDDFSAEKCPHLLVMVGPNLEFIFSIKNHNGVPRNQMGFSAPQRKWASLSLGQEIQVKPYRMDSQRHYLSNVTFTVDFLSKKATTTDSYDTDKMKDEFRMQFAPCRLALSTKPESQQIVFQFLDKKMLMLQVKELEVMVIEGAEKQKSKMSAFGVLSPNTDIVFESAEGSTVKLVGKSKRLRSHYPPKHQALVGYHRLRHQRKESAAASRVFQAVEWTTGSPQQALPAHALWP